MTLGQVHLELKPVAPPGGDRARPSTFGCGVAISERVLSATRAAGRAVAELESLGRYCKMPTMRPSRIFETVLYAEDLAAAERFYRDVLGLEVIGRSDLAVVLRCGDGVLLIFDPRKSGVPARDVPSHGSSGVGHIAFAAKPEELNAWRKQLREAGIPIQLEMDWEEGGRSIYFRDPAGNVVELAPPTLWGGGWEF